MQMPFSNLPMNAAVSLEGVPVVATDHPCNVRPVVSAVEGIIHDRLINRKGPLVVITSEVHHIAMHSAVPLAIMKLFVGHVPRPLRVAHGIEWPHNLYDEIMNRKFGKTLAPELRHHIENGGPAEQKLERAFLATVNPQGAPLARRNTMRFARDHNISVRAVDGARMRPAYTTDINESLTRQYAEKYAPELFTLDRTSAAAKSAEMRLRNIITVDLVLAHLQESRAQLYVLSYGSGHVFGMREYVHRYPHPFRDSLTYMFLEKGIDVLPVFVTTPASSVPNDDRYAGTKIIPVDANPGMRHGIVVNGLSAEIFHNLDSRRPESDFLCLAEQYSRRAFEYTPDPGIKAAFPFWSHIMKPHDPGAAPKRQHRPRSRQSQLTGGQLGR